MEAITVAKELKVGLRRTSLIAASAALVSASVTAAVAFAVPSSQASTPSPEQQLTQLRNAVVNGWKITIPGLGTGFYRAYAFGPWWMQSPFVPAAKYEKRLGLHGACAEVFTADGHGWVLCRDGQVHTIR